MADLKLLGASERNMKAINMALSLGGSKTVAGMATPDIKFKESNDKVQPFIHPFKLSIVTEEDTPYLNINEGRISICADTQYRTYVMFYDEYKLDLSELSTDSDYFVILALKYDWDGSGDDFDNTKYTCNVYFTTAPITTNYIPAVRGFQTTVIGKINRDTVDDKVIWSVVRQDLTSDLFLDYHAMRHPFSLTASSDAFEDGKLKNSYSLSDFEFHVEAGAVIVGDSIINVQEKEFTANAKTYVYCSINQESLSAAINPQQQQLQFHDAQNKTYNHLVGIIDFNAQQFGIAIDQYIFQEIGAGADTYKVKTIKEDAQPDFLSAKFIFDEADNDDDKKLSGYTHTLIGGDCVSSAVTQPGLSGTQYKLKPVWMYKNISNYDKNKDQYLTNKKGTLKWSPAGLDVSGSLASWEEIEEVSGKNILRWKPEYKPSGFADDFYFMASYRDDNNAVTNKSVLSGVSFGKDSLGEEKDAVMIWSRENGEPYVSLPPPSSNTTTEWCLVGEKTSGVAWKPYNKLNITLTGSIENLFELVDTTSGKALRVKPQFDGSIDQFHFVNLEDDGSLSATSFFGDSQTDGVEAMMIWNYDNLQPQTFFCEEERLDDDLVLAGTKEDGFYWVPLFGTLSGDLYKVKVSESDPSAAFLNRKIWSDLSSLIVTTELNGDQYVNLEINPNYFYSEDNSVYIEQTEDGLNFMVSAFLTQISQTDDYPDYLCYKLDSENGSLTAEVVNNDGYETFNIQINPNYFYSSDESISIEQTQDGLDFTISSYLVQVQEGDLPEYLADKITSENGSLSTAIGENGEGMTVDLSINPDYFYSSDGTISIENTEDGLDFTLSSAVVSVSEGDDPDFLFDKITSDNGSLSTAIVDSGEYQQVSITINPEYFYSSDNSIAIEQTQNGLDFTISSYMVQVQDGDLPEFLADKISSENGSLSTAIGQNGEGMTVDLSINPDYFYSEDGSVNIEQTEDGLNFMVSAFLTQISQTDNYPDYLCYKLDSENGSLSAEIVNRNGYETFNIQINPNYFYSSDGTISIEETQNGLDFNLSSYMVQVQSGDLPEFLADKISSQNGSLSTAIGQNGEGMTVDLSINPSYFYSSDGTISIEETQNGLDFTLSSAVVSVSEDDGYPDFLCYKIDSENESLDLEIVSRSGYETFNMQINPDYFYSSDESVDIEETEDGIDFSGAGKVQVTGEDTADFLENKLVVDSSISDLITLEEDNGVLKISSALSGSGLLKVENGQISYLTPPSNGKYLLACDNGSFSWVEYADCEDACSGQV